MQIDFYPTEKNARKMEEILHRAGLRGVKVKYRDFLPYFISEGEKIDGSDDVRNGILELNMGNQCRVVIRELQEGAALVRAWRYALYAGGEYHLRDGVALLVTAEDGDRVTVIRVPWATESISEAREFAARYRFPDHFIGAGREKYLKRQPYIKIA